MLGHTKFQLHLTCQSICHSQTAKRCFVREHMQQGLNFQGVP
uniref:Uncharacterized protein n=1 Tax=Rhizophora mucronata TaxID=61149 RepID=A0A2P2J8J1_RHIMU